MAADKLVLVRDLKLRNSICLIIIMQFLLMGLEMRFELESLVATFDFTDEWTHVHVRLQVGGQV